MMGIRSALTAPFRLAPIDLLSAVAIAFILISLVAGPALSQDASPTLLPTASAAPPPTSARSSHPLAAPSSPREPFPTTTTNQ